MFPQALEKSFLAGLTDELRYLLKDANEAPYEVTWADTKALMERLLVKYRDEERVSFCYGPSGPQWVTDELFREAATDARAKGIGLHIHALETIAQYEACRRLYQKGLMRHLRELGAIGPRTVIAHGVFLTDDDIDVLAEEGASMSSWRKAFASGLAATTPL